MNKKVIDGMGVGGFLFLLRLWGCLRIQKKGKQQRLKCWGEWRLVALRGYVV